MNTTPSDIPLYLSFTGLLGIAFFLILERVSPFRAHALPLWQRWLINFSLSFCNLLIVDQFFVVLLQRTGLFSEIFHFNLYGRLGLNSFWRIVLTIVILDFAMYLWHRLNHALPFLWRFHRVHHTDLEVDVSTASRFHFGEMTISAVINYALMLSLGATFWEIRIFKVFFVFMTQLTHTNLKLALGFEKLLGALLVPPSMHRVHHSNRRRETDSNYGTIFSFWDKMLGTYVGEVDANTISFGLKELSNPRELTLPKLLVLPFRKEGGSVVRKVVLLFFTFFCFIGFSFAEEPKSRAVEFDYELILNDIPQNTKELKVWLPVLPQNPYQEIEEVKIFPQEFSHITYDKIYNNKILSFTIPSPQAPSLNINVYYRIRRYEQGAKPKEEQDLSKFLKANRLVTLSPQVKALARDITKGKKTTLEKARAIYDYIFKTVEYNKTIPGWGNGDTERVCLVRSGNCTDFHSLFISLARAQKIPANFIMGVPLPKEAEGEIKGYHCWAQFYDKKLGWVPVDISEAWKDKSMYDYYFGRLTENRLEFSQGRDIVLEPSAHTEPLNYFLYPHVEVDGQSFSNVKVTFRFKDVEDVKGGVKLTKTIEQ